MEKKTETFLLLKRDICMGFLNGLSISKTVEKTLNGNVTEQIKIQCVVDDWFSSFS